MITLPRAWVKKFNLEKGQELDVVENGSNLIVSPDSAQALKSTKISISNIHRGMIWRKLVFLL